MTTSKIKKFENFWNELLVDLRKPKKIKNWTVKKGFFGEDFTAKLISNPTTGGTVEITTVKGTKINANLEEFHMIHKNWDLYLSGKILRKEFTKRSFVTKYTISIIHHFAR